ncbi:tripartite tricarboxylate transporter TctB family protein [Streptomyces sp. NPDC000594]|uniref:tripartite tricarboxylate transporter TctB family protein n=1 Tax=Streptomyces sp. NPDC000594 TaxID=3154261 RepID=UPI00332E12FD
MSTTPTAPGPAPGPAGGKQRPAFGEWAVTAGLLTVGIITLLDGLGQAESTSASGVGAGFMPTVVGVLLISLSLALGVQVARGRRGEADAGEGDIDVRRTRWVPFAVCTGAALLFIAGVDTLGYVIVSTVAFWLTAWAFGARDHLRSAAIATVFSLAVYLVFTRALGISLAAGVLEGVL